jgi:hypothetical protein
MTGRSDVFPKSPHKDFPLAAMETVASPQFFNTEGIHSSHNTLNRSNSPVGVW